MHELALARSLIEIVDEYAAEHHVTHIKRINVRLGEMSAMTRALHFCFSSVAEGTSCEGAILNIEIIPLTVYCGKCDAIKAPSGRYSFRCLECGMPAHKVITGREMQLASLELFKTEEAFHTPPTVQQSLRLKSI
jgi:hydrogenase nickel incorporation protein HypA/HybF|tara:strand:- start:157 stop:561 length:405 start_codon:yes stop_codon:yes gene_type:complete